jgi:hypothetical protein
MTEAKWLTGSIGIGPRRASFVRLTSAWSRGRRPSKAVGVGGLVGSGQRGLREVGGGERPG